MVAGREMRKQNSFVSYPLSMFNELRLKACLGSDFKTNHADVPTKTLTITVIVTTHILPFSLKTFPTTSVVTGLKLQSTVYCKKIVAFLYV